MIVIAGRDKGRTGEVIEMHRDDERVLVRGVNMVKRHQRQSASQEGGIISKEAPIHLSNVALADPKDGKPTRVGFKIRRQGRRSQESALCQTFGSRDRWLIPTRSKRKDPTSRRGQPTAEQAVKAAKDDKRAARQARADKAAADGKSGKPAAPREPEQRVPARLRVQFDDAIRGKLAEQFGYKNRFEVPTLDKIVINMGIGEGVADKKKVDGAAADLALIAGQKAVITKARKSIATYKLRTARRLAAR